MRKFILASLFIVSTVASHQLSGSPPNGDDSAQTNASGDHRVSDESTGPQQSGPQQSSSKQSSSKDDRGPTAKAIMRLNLPLKTIGGAQLWTDHLWRDGYRIQQNSVTGHFRLVDAKDVRRAWGGRAHCDEVLAELCPKSGETNRGQRVVVLIHGLMRTHHSMKPLQESLRSADDQEVIRFSYASARGSIGNHATALRNVLEDFPADTQFSFVGHSMGNIVVRHLISDLQANDDPRGILRRCQSMVMLGPPNQGAAIARRLAPTGLFGLVTGKGGMELGPEWKTFVKNLGIPPFPFTIIAGDLSGSTVQNPLLDGSSDYIVSVDETKLDGAESFHVVPVVHSFLMSDEKSMKLTIEFIKQHRSDPSRLAE